MPPPVRRYIPFSELLYDQETGLAVRGRKLSHGDILEPMPALPGGSGDVVGPALAVADHLAVFDGVTGKLLKDGGAVPGGGGALLTATVTLTDAQIKALPTTQYTIVPALGVGKIIVPVLFYGRLTWFGDYTNIDAAAAFGTISSSGGSFFNTYMDEASVWFKPSEFFAGGETNDFILQSASITDGFGAVGAPLGSVWSGTAQEANVAMNTHMLNGAAGNLTGGHANNTLKVTVWYVVLDV